MGVFTYKAVDGSFQEVTGSVVADTPRQARAKLRSEGLTIRQVAPHTPAAAKGTFRGCFTTLSATQLQAFYRELSTLLAVGIPLLEALDTISNQHEGRLRATVLFLRDRVSAGVSLAEAMAEQPRTFDEVMRSIVEVGQNTGTLEQSLQKLAEFKERAHQLRGRIGTALAYPLIVLTTGLLVSVFLMTYVVPNLLTVLIESGKPLPAATRLVKSLSDLLVHRWWLPLLVAVAAGALWFKLAQVPRVRRMWHGLQLRLPLLGPLIVKQTLARVAMTIATLGRSGVSFVTALQLAQKGTHNTLLRQALADCEKAVFAGRDFADALADAGRRGGRTGSRSIIPPMVIQVFAVGQESGRLEEMLERLAADYDQQVAVAAQRLTTLLEPVIILILAVFVGFIAFATILPIMEAGNVF